MEGIDLLVKQYSSKSTLSMLLEESSESTTHNKYNMDEEILYDDFDPAIQEYNRKGANGSNQEKSNFSCKDLIRAIYNSEISKRSTNENNVFQSSSLTDSPTLTSFGLLAAEDDGSPMDDLPEFSTSTDVLAMGIEDFILIDKKTSAHLMHVRITQPTNTNSDDKKYKMSNGSTVEVMQYSKHNTELNKETTLGFEDLDMSGLDEGPSPLVSPRERQDSDSGRYPEIIQMFRTQSEDDQMLASHLSAALAVDLTSSLSISADGANLMQKHSDLRHALAPLHTASPASPTSSARVRSSSGNLMISCRRPGTERWSVPKSIPVSSQASANQSTLRVRAVSTATGSTKPPTPNRAIPSTGPAHGIRINTEFNKPLTRRSHNFDDTSPDPFRLYADQQTRKHRAHSNSLPEADLNAMLPFALNPHTSSSKMVLTPTSSTSRPGSALGGSTEKKFFLPPSGQNAKNLSHNTSVRVINATETNKISPVPHTSSKELAAYFNTMSVNDACSDSDEEDDDCGFGGGKVASGNVNAFSFVDSLPMSAPIHKTSPPGKTHGSSHASLSSKASSQSVGIAVEGCDEITACSSGSDYSASDYEALHSIHVNVHADIMSKRGSGSNGHNNSNALGILRDAISSPPRHPTSSAPTTSAPTTPRGRTRTDSNASNVSVTRVRTESESTKRPSLYERFFGSPAAGKGRKTLDADGGNDNLSRRSSRNTMESRPPVEEEDGDGTSFVRNLDTGAVIELDADGDGAVTAILVSPSVVFREERPVSLQQQRSRVNSESPR